MVLAAPGLGTQGGLKAQDADPAAPADLIRMYGEVFAERDGQKLLADVYLPVVAPDELRPALLMIHGGAWMSGSRWNMMLHANQLARAGYAVINVDYRLAPTHKHPAQIEDCRAAWNWMCDNATRFQLDPERLAVYGYSAGGHLACLLGLDSPADLPPRPRPRPKAIVAGGAVCDFAWLSEQSSALSYFLGGSPRERPEAYRSAAPITFVSPDDPPVFLFHGGTDHVVPLSSPQRLLQALQQAGVPGELVVRPKSGHVETFFDTESPRLAIQFLDRELRRAPPAASATNPAPLP